MAKNITIAEDGVSRNFTAKKLRTNLQGGGNCTWVPEDEAVDYVDLKSIKINQNGTYKASDSNCDGFDEVKVDVPSEVIPQKTITANGEYDAYEESGMAGYAHVSVNVQGGGDVYAFARTLYESGKTVTATNGVTTLISDNTGYFVFAIPNSGVWTFNSDGETATYNFDEYGVSQMIALTYLPYSNAQYLIVDAKPASYDGVSTWDALDTNGGGEIINTSNMPAVRLGAGEYAKFDVLDGSYFTAYIVCSASKIWDEPDTYAYYYNMSFTKEQNNNKSPMIWRHRGFNDENVVCSTYGTYVDVNSGAFYLYDAVYTISVNKGNSTAKLYCNGTLIATLPASNFGDFCVNGSWVNSALISSVSGILDVRYVALLNTIEADDVIINNQLSLMNRFHIGSVTPGFLPYSDQTKIAVNLLASDYNGGNKWGDFDIIGSPSKITDDNHSVIRFGSGAYATLDIPATWNMTIYMIVKVNANVDVDGRVFSMCESQVGMHEPCVYNRGTQLYAGTYGNDADINLRSDIYSILALQLDDTLSRWYYFSTADTGKLRYLNYYSHGRKLYLSSSINGLNQTDENIMYIGIVNEVEAPNTIWRNIQALRQQLGVLYPA